MNALPGPAGQRLERRDPGRRQLGAPLALAPDPDAQRQAVAGVGVAVWHPPRVAALRDVAAQRGGCPCLGTGTRVPQPARERLERGDVARVEPPLPIRHAQRGARIGGPLDLGPGCRVAPWRLSRRVPDPRLPYAPSCRRARDSGTCSKNDCPVSGQGALGVDRPRAPAVLAAVVGRLQELERVTMGGSGNFGSPLDPLGRSLSRVGPSPQVAPYNGPVVTVSSLSVSRWGRTAATVRRGCCSASTLPHGSGMARRRLASSRRAR